jgi:putative transposase
LEESGRAAAPPAHATLIQSGEDPIDKLRVAAALQSVAPSSCIRQDFELLLRRSPRRIGGMKAEETGFNSVAGRSDGRMLGIPARYWPHAPLHQLSEGGTFIVTSGTYQKEHFYSTEERLKGLHGGLLKYAAKYDWRLEAWAVFPNHYHFVAHSPEDAQDGAASLSLLLADYQHATSWVNGLDRQEGRKVWHNFWETRLTYQKSYLARLNYVHQNAVKHGIVHVANEYPWCSASWLERTATKAQVNMIYSLKTDKLKIVDDF